MIAGMSVLQLAGPGLQAATTSLPPGLYRRVAQQTGVPTGVLYRLALAANNAGEGAVRRYGGTIPPYPEPRRYVARVLALYRYFLIREVAS